LASVAGLTVFQMPTQQQAVSVYTQFKMTSRIAIFILIFTFLSCHFSGPRDLQDTKSITEIEELNKMVGTWKATEVTYDMVRERNYVVDTIQLLLNSDSTFKAINIPDCFADPFGKPVNKRLVNAQGQWQVSKIKDKYLLMLRFDKGDLFKKNEGFGFEMYKRDTSIFAFQYVGDPDQADMLEFRKAN